MKLGAVLTTPLSRVVAVWVGGLAAGGLAMLPTQVFGPIGGVLFVAAFAYGLLRPRAAAAGGVLCSLGAYLLLSELQLVESRSAYNRIPGGRCSPEDVTAKVLFEVAVLLLGTALSTFGFATALRRTP